MVYPAVEKVTPQVAKVYLIDHRELDSMANGLETIRNNTGPLTAARATAVLGSQLRIHLNK